jgi:hypothetical protein
MTDRLNTDTPAESTDTVPQSSDAVLECCAPGRAAFLLPVTAAEEK